MIIEKLKIIFENSEYVYEFSSKNNLIYSKENSKGKTTLIRFILYSLGYQIPATEGIGDFSKFTFCLSLISNKKKIVLTRKDTEIILESDNNTTSYELPLQEKQLLAAIFGIEDLLVLNNLLAVFYIDQEKGWTMLNRGKIIGNIRFNIEEYIAGLSGKDICSYIEEKQTINEELKKYRYFKNVADINEEYTEYNNKNKYEELDFNELLQKQKEYSIKKRALIKKISTITKSISENKNFADLICDFGVMIAHNGEEIEITKDNLINYNNNQELLELKRKNLKIELEEINIELKKIEKEITEKNTLFSLDSIIENLENQIADMNIDVNSVDKIINQLNNKRKKINQKIREELSYNNQQLIEFYDTINKYAIELGIKQYIKNDTPSFVLTNKLKGFSGRVLAQMSYVFKLAYLKSIDYKYGIKLPIIIDSPRTNELSESSTDDMMKILKRDFSDHQIILASIYKSNILECQIVDLNDGLMKH